MIVECSICIGYHDDERQWTLCPHGPLWAPLEAYCRAHDLVDCVICQAEGLEHCPDCKGMGKVRLEFDDGDEAWGRCVTCGGVGRRKKVDEVLSGAIPG